MNAQPSTAQGLSGVGIGLRRAHFEQWMSRADAPLEIDFLEFVPEVFLGVGGRTRRVLDMLGERIQLVPHGVSMSFGGPDPLRNTDELLQLCRRIRAPFYSDHICASSVGGVESFDLLPLPFCAEAAEYVASRVRTAAGRLELPVVLENISYYATMPGSTWREGEFVRTTIEQSGAGLLLDVSNALVNAKNFGIDPRSVLDQLPLERTAQIHLAGHRFEKAWSLWIDDHASAPSEESLSLYRYALQKIGRPVPTLIEWDQHVPPLETVLAQARRVRKAMADAFAPVERRASLPEPAVP